MKTANGSYSDTTPLALRIFDITLLTIFVAIGIFGNILILTAVLSTKNLRTLANVFIVNIAIADLIVTVDVLPVILANVILQRNALSEVICLINAGLTVITCACSIWTLATISINRYIHVCRHTMYDAVFSRRNVIVIVVVNWSFWIIVSFSAIKWVENHFNTDSKVCIFDHKGNLYFTIFIMIVGIGIPVFVTFTCYYLIYKMIKKSQKRIEGHNAVNKAKNEAAIKKKKRENQAMLTLFVAFILFIIFWCPYGITAILYGLPSIEVNGYIFKYSAWLGMSNSCINSFVYGVMNKTFSDAYKRILCIWRRFCFNNSVSNHSEMDISVITQNDKSVHN